MTNDVIYRSKVRVERIKGSFRRAHLPVDEGPVYFGLHSEIATHYGVDTQVVDPHNATLDYMVAAAAG